MRAAWCGNPLDCHIRNQLWKTYKITRHCIWSSLHHPQGASVSLPCADHQY